MLADDDSKDEDGGDDDLDLAGYEGISAAPAPRTAPGRKIIKTERAKASEKRNKGKTVKPEPKVEAEETPGKFCFVSLLVLSN
jgi:hypothetical protein